MSNTPPPPPPGYGQGQPDYGQGQPDYGQGQPDYGQPPAYGQQGPYAAPVVRPSEMPPSVNIAAKLIWAAIALSLLTTVLTFAMIDTIIDQAMEDAGLASVDEDAVRAGAIFAAVIGLTIGIGLNVLLVVFIQKGANWARITWTVLAGLGLVFGLIGLASPQPALFLVLGLVGMALSVVTLVFLWKKESNPWFAKAGPR